MNDHLRERVSQTSEVGSLTSTISEAEYTLLEALKSTLTSYLSLHTSSHGELMSLSARLQQRDQDQSTITFILIQGEAFYTITPAMPTRGYQKMHLRPLITVIYERAWDIFWNITRNIIWNGVIYIMLGKEWSTKYKYYHDRLEPLFKLLRYLLVWLRGFTVMRIGKLALLIKSHWGIILTPPEVDAMVWLIREIYFDQVYDGFYRLGGDDVVVDVGAHVGLFTLKVAGKVKRVIAVEPHPLNYGLLKLNITLNNLRNVIPIKVALSNYTGKAKLYQGSSITHTLRCQHFKSEPDKALDVDVETLDSLLDKLGVSRVTFIKIDVEGSELEVLKGSEKVLTVNKQLFLAIAAYHYPEVLPEVVSFLQARGFKVFSNSNRAYVYAFKPHTSPRLSLGERLIETL